MKQLKPWHFGIFFLILFIVFCCVVPDSGYDKYFWISWAKDISENGLGAIYLNPEVNNFPLVLWLLKAYTLFFSAADVDVFSINYLKCFVILFDFTTLLGIVFLLKKNNKPLMLVLVFLFNPAFWYNTIIWGQVDTIHTFFVFCSLLCSLKAKPLSALIFLLLALNTKIQALIFLPLIMLMIIPLVRNEKNKLTYIFPALAALQILVLLPFLISGTIQQTIHSLINSSIDFYPTLSRNAYNLWYLLFADPLSTSDQVTFFLSLKFWGIILFGLFYALVLFLFLRRDEKGTPEQRIFLVFTLISLGFFFFPTQMHERYAHPVILFSGLYAVFSGRYLIIVLCSLAYVLNMEAVLQVFSYVDDEILGFTINYKTWLIFSPVLISLLYLVSISAGIIDLQRKQIPLSKP